MRPGALLSHQPNSRVVACVLVALLAFASLPSGARAGASPASAPAARVISETGPRWSELSPGQRNSLRPLERDWSHLDVDRKLKWMTLANRMPGMQDQERNRIQARMTEWAALSPQQRGQVRMGFQEAKQVSPADRQARWEAYQALPPEQKRQLAARAAPPPASLTARAASGPRAGDRADRNNPLQAKSNIVTNPELAARPRPIGPTVVQARPGATTTLISKVPAPPAHQQTGLPKIAATPEFVDRNTLLPQRGPQGAATRSAAASETTARP